MASLADLANVYAPGGPEAGFSLADIEIESQYSKDNAALQSERLLRNYSTYDLPRMLSSQAARGAYYSSGTTQRTAMLKSGLQDNLGDIQLNLAREQARLASNALLAQTGIKLGV